LLLALLFIHCGEVDCKHLTLSTVVK
jgi:hypothetical protein